MRLQASGTLRVICVVLSHPVGGNLLPQQLGTNVPSTGAVQFLRPHQCVGHGLFLRMRENFPEAPEQTSSYLSGQTCVTWSSLNRSLARISRRPPMASPEAVAPTQLPAPGRIRVLPSRQEKNIALG